MKKIEIVTTNIEDCLKVNKSKADRIILLENLSLGGITPGIDYIKDVVERTNNIEISVMLRMETKNEIYNNEQFNEIKNQLLKIRELNVDKIVFSSLTSSNKINYEQLEEIIRLKGDLKLVFGKGFDLLDNNVKFEEIEKLNTYDIDTLLTGGTSENSNDFYKKLQSKTNINIMPGAGVKLETSKNIVDIANVSWLHIGSAARNNGEISIDKINKIKELIN